MPQVEPKVVFTDRLTEFDRGLFGVDEMPEEDIDRHARTIAERVMAKTLSVLPAFDRQ